MRLARGPRPWAIRLFAALFASAALASFFYDLQHLGAVRQGLADLWPAVATQDGAIIVTSARLTIGLIPVALIWLFASRAARWIIPVLALGKLAVTLWTLPAPGGLALTVLAASLAGAALLFTPRAAQWIASKGRRNGAVLD